MKGNSGISHRMPLQPCPSSSGLKLQQHASLLVSFSLRSTIRYTCTVQFGMLYRVRYLYLKEDDLPQNNFTSWSEALFEAELQPSKKLALIPTYLHMVNRIMTDSSNSCSPEWKVPERAMTCPPKNLCPK
jgi:hypothetical protein